MGQVLLTLEQSYGYCYIYPDTTRRRDCHDGLPEKRPGVVEVGGLSGAAVLWTGSPMECLGDLSRHDPWDWHLLTLAWFS